MNSLCTLKIVIESLNSANGCIKDQWPYPNKDQNTKPQSGASSIIQSPKSGLKILQLIHLPEPYFVHNWLVQSEQNSNGWLNLSQTLKLNQDRTLPDLIFSQVLAILDGWKDEEISSYVRNLILSKPKIQTPSIIQSRNSGLKGHGCSLHFQNQDREPKFGICVYQRPVTISKSISGCQTPVRNLQHPPKPQIRT